MHPCCQPPRNANFGRWWMVDQSKGVGLNVSYLAENSLVEGFDYEFQAKALGKEDRPMVEHNPPPHADRVPLIPLPIAL